jgi:glycosyltransferase involved in cell wall biosynthesis
MRSSRYDVIHYQWPEEYTGYRTPPTRDQLAKIEECLIWWNSNSTTILTVHNLYPHGRANDLAFRELYECFYRNTRVITHYSETSRRLVCDRYPIARDARHVVHHPDGCEATIAIQKQRGSRRKELGIGEDEFVVLVFGQIRSLDEVKLLQRAYDLARIPRKRLLMAGKLGLQIGSWRARLFAAQWRWWLKQRNAFVDSRFLPEDELSRFIDSSDVVVVPRLGGLNSAILFMGMAFGRLIIAPDCGAYPEQLSETRNLIYRTGDPVSFAARLEEASALDTDSIGRENALIAAKWKWRDICQASLEASVD